MSTHFTGPVPIPPTQAAPLRVLVTGASRGIGFEIVKQYSQAHADNVVFAAVRDPKGPTSKALAAFAVEHSNVHIVPMDMDNEDNIRQSLSSVTSVTEYLDVLINNAAQSGEGDPLKVTKQQLTALFHTNVAGPITTIQTYLPLLRKSTQGAKVINVSSGLGSNQLAFIQGSPFISYGITKAALNYTNTVFRHTVPDVTFLAISPGWVETDMGSAGGYKPPTDVKDSVQAIRYYIATKSLANSGDFLDIMTGNIVPF